VLLAIVWYQKLKPKKEATKGKKKRVKKKKSKKRRKIHKGDILGYFISGFDVTSEPSTIFKNMPDFKAGNLKFDSNLSKEQVFHLKVSEFEPQVLFQKCTDANARKILSEVVSYIFPNQIEGIYPFQLNTGDETNYPDDGEHYRR
jgi:hypothetical protein